MKTFKIVFNGLSALGAVLLSIIAFVHTMRTVTTPSELAMGIGAMWGLKYLFDTSLADIDKELSD